jgi:hypothetical protein
MSRTSSDNSPAIRPTRAGQRFAMTEVGCRLALSNKPAWAASDDFIYTSLTPLPEASRRGLETVLYLKGNVFVSSL